MTSLPVPSTHLDLLTRSIHGVLTTIMPDGQPQSSLVWCDYDGECVRVNTTLERQKGRNLSTNPKATLLVVDPDDTTRYIEIRGEVELIRAGAFEHLDVLTHRYTKHCCYYGHVFSVEQKTRETRVIGRIHAQKITLDAIHK